jgi:hypothetical protein
VFNVRVGDEVLEQLEGRRVQPLQVIKEEGERVLLSGEDAQKGPEHRLEPILRFLRRDLRHSRLFANDELEFGDEVYDELAVHTHGIADRVSPTLNHCLVLTENLADQSLEGLGESRVRNVPLVLVELTRNKNAPRQHDCLVQLVYERRLTDTR